MLVVLTCYVCRNVYLFQHLMIDILLRVSDTLFWCDDHDNVCVCACVRVRMCVSLCVRACVRACALKY